MRILLAVGLLGACADSSSAPVASTDLRAAFGVADVDPVGVTVGADGSRFVFDEARGLYRVDADGAHAVVAMAQMPTPSVDTPLTLPITDVVALGPDRFAVTAIGDGFILDTHAMTLTRHFCYVPDGDGTPVFITQRTDALAYDAATDRLYAQPVATDDTNVVQWSQVIGYQGSNGSEQEWYSLPLEYKASAMLAVPDGLILASGAQLSRLDTLTTQLSPLEDLARYGIASIDGLARDGASILVVDRTTDQLVELPASIIE